MTIADDDSILADLGHLVRAADPVPWAVLASAHDAWAWRTIDAQLAQLTKDTLTTAAAGVRGPSARLLTYEAGAVTIEVEVTAADGAIKLVGQVVPPRATRIRVETSIDGTELKADHLGRFAATGLPPGPFRLRLPDEQPPVCTEWTVI